MCELILRTNKGEYCGGDTIYGAVYVRIDRPSAACGVRIHFSGIESCNCNPIAVGDNQVFHEQVEYIKCDNIVLWQSDGPFSIGSYVFPFQKRLPRDLPGSFYLRSNQGPRWMAEIVYKVHAELIDATEVNTSQLLIIQQDLSSSFRVDCPTAVEKTTVIKGLFRQGTLSATLRINKKEYYVGEMINVDIDFAIGGSSTPNISSLSCSLKKELVITRGEKKEHVSTSGSGLPSFFHKLCSVSNLPSAQSSHTIQPEGGATTVWNCHMLARDHVNLNKGVQNLLVPLSDYTGKKWVPTTAGCHIFCLYWLEVDVLVKDSVVLTLELPLLHIRCNNPQWEQWVPPDWLKHCCQLPYQQHECSVTPDILGSRAFSNLPCFHVI